MSQTILGVPHILGTSFSALIDAFVPYVLPCLCLSFASNRATIYIFYTRAATIAIVLNCAFDLQLVCFVDTYKETDPPSAGRDFSSATLEQSLPIYFTRQLNPIRLDSSSATRVRTPRDIKLLYNLGAKIATRLRKTI